MSRRVLAVALLCIAGSSQAALLGRAPTTPGGTDYQAYYDTVLDVTWLANANLGAGSVYDDGSDTTDGRMSWTSAQAWIASLNEGHHLGGNSWRLPTIGDTGTPGCNYAFSGTDCGYNVDMATSEMAHLFYSTLGNTAAYNTSGVSQPCVSASPNYCLTNTGPFSNLQRYYYWSGTAQAPYIGDVWYFMFTYGFQQHYHKSFKLYAWAVSDGDPLAATVPVPAAVWLFGGALGALSLLARKVAA